MAADLLKKVLDFPLSSLNLKGLSFYFEGLTYVYMLLTFSFQCHFRFILINILGKNPSKIKCLFTLGRVWSEE